MTIEPVHILALFAVVAPVVLVVQALRKRIRVTCCSGAIDARHDLRMRSAYARGESTPVDVDPPG